LDRLERIKKECFWDYDASSEWIKNVAEGDDLNQKQFIFEKILLNSTRLFEDLNIFNQKDLKMLIENYRTPAFNKQYCERRKNLVEVYFLNKPLTIKELQWIT